jgi:hypothetical protein
MGFNPPYCTLTINHFLHFYCLHALSKNTAKSAKSVKTPAMLPDLTSKTATSDKMKFG